MSPRKDMKRWGVQCLLQPLFWEMWSDTDTTRKGRFRKVCCLVSPASLEFRPASFMALSIRPNSASCFLTTEGGVTGISGQILSCSVGGGFALVEGMRDTSPWPPGWRRNISGSYSSFTNFSLAVAKSLYFFIKSVCFWPIRSWNSRWFRPSISFWHLSWKMSTWPCTNQHLSYALNICRKPIAEQTEILQGRCHSVPSLRCELIEQSFQPKQTALARSTK